MSNDYKRLPFTLTPSMPSLPPTNLNHHHRNFAQVHLQLPHSHAYNHTVTMPSHHQQQTRSYPYRQHHNHNLRLPIPTISPPQNTLHNSLTSSVHFLLPQLSKPRTQRRRRRVVPSNAHDAETPLRLVQRLLPKSFSSACRAESQSDAECETQSGGESCLSVDG